MGHKREGGQGSRGKERAQMRGLLGKATVQRGVGTAGYAQLVAQLEREGRGTKRKENRNNRRVSRKL
jgi:hypothetical protein